MTPGAIAIGVTIVAALIAYLLICWLTKHEDDDEPEPPPAPEPEADPDYITRIKRGDRTFIL